MQKEMELAREKQIHNWEMRKKEAETVIEESRAAQSKIKTYEDSYAPESCSRCW